MDSHEWRERDELGTRYYRASHHGGRWTIQTTLKSDPDWQTLPTAEVSADLWRTLRDILWRKYQRRRCPWDRIVEIDRILGDDSQPGQH
jgi:hypothetical protein